MSEAPGQWAAVDRYVSDLLLQDGAGLAAVLEASAAAGLPAIAVSPPQGKWLSLMARAMGARRILEVGTLGGYSAIWLARALPPGGRLVTLELDPKHAEVARGNFARTGVESLIELRLGPAKDTLDRMIAQGEPPFDFIFIDADKQGYPGYFAQALRLARRGSVIVADNVVRDGAVADPASTDPSVQAVRRFHELLAAEPRVSATVLQTVGIKGYDGLAMVLVTGEPSTP